MRNQNPILYTESQFNRGVKMNICSKYEITKRNIYLCKTKIKLWLNLNNLEQIRNDCSDKQLIKTSYQSSI